MYEDIWSCSSTQKLRDRILHGLDGVPAGRDRAVECARRRKDVREALAHMDNALDKIEHCMSSIRKQPYASLRSESSQQISRAQWVAARFQALSEIILALQEQDRVCCRGDGSTMAVGYLNELGVCGAVGTGEVDNARGPNCNHARSNACAGGFTARGATDADNIGDPCDVGVQPKVPPNSVFLAPLIAIEYNILIADIQRNQARADQLLEELRYNTSQFTISGVVGYIVGWVLSPLYIVRRPCPCMHRSEVKLVDEGFHDLSHSPESPQVRLVSTPPSPT